MFFVETEIHFKGFFDEQKVQKNKHLTDHKLLNDRINLNFNYTYLKMKCLFFHW